MDEAQWKGQLGVRSLWSGDHSWLGLSSDPSLEKTKSLKFAAQSATTHYCLKKLGLSHFCFPWF